MLQQSRSIYVAEIDRSPKIGSRSKNNSQPFQQLTGNAREPATFPMLRFCCSKQRRMEFAAMKLMKLKGAPASRGLLFTAEQDGECCRIAAAFMLQKLAGSWSRPRFLI